MISIFRLLKQIPSRRSEATRWRLDTGRGFHDSSVTIDLDASPTGGYRGTVATAGSANLVERLSDLIGSRVVLERPTGLYRALGGIRPSETIAVAAENGTRRRSTITDVVHLERLPTSSRERLRSAPLTRMSVRDPRWVPGPLDEGSSHA